MRLLFVDGWNSFWHFFFGCLSVFSWQITFFFSLYQLLDPFEANIVIDFSEFFLGHNLMVLWLFSHVFYMYNSSIQFLLRRAIHQTQLNIPQIRYDIPNHQKPVVFHVNFEII
jgi:hypothetical protein